MKRAHKLMKGANVSEPLLDSKFSLLLVLAVVVLNLIEGGVALALILRSCPQ